MQQVTWGNNYWPYALIACSLIILGPEIYALVTNHANTLSDYVWRELRVSFKPGRTVHTAAWFLTQGTFLVLNSWLLFHLWYGKYR